MSTVENNDLVNIPYSTEDGPESIDEYFANNDDIPDYQAYIETTIDNQKQTDNIKKLIDWNPINTEPINEFNCDGLAAMCFPKLFMN